MNRIPKILDDLSKLNLKIKLYSSWEEIDDKTDVVLVDSYGESIKLYSISKLVFLGKSLINSLKDDSGQNPIEPARLGCKILHGPNVSNFIDIYEYLKSLDITKVIRTPEDLSQSIVEEFKNNKNIDGEIIEKIENYGQNTLNNVLNEIKIYINK